MPISRPITYELTRAITRAISGASIGFYVGQLFANGEQGAWYDPSDFSTLFQDSAGTTPVTAIGQPVGRMLDKSGRGNHTIQATATARPVLQQDGGGKYYLAFDGVDDFLVTGNINFTGTDKMTVWAGVTKLSDAAVGTICELGTNTNTVNGSFVLLAPGAAAAATYRGELRGTVAPTGISATGFVAPITNVLAYAFDNAGTGTGAAAQIRPRVNGVARANFSGTTAGNFGNLPIYIGRRGGTSLPFNGRIYGLIIRGAASTAEEITNTERYLAGKTGITL